ncbi:MAG: hypothetical protein WD065_05130 [Planctomycetaceae bacterium]
MYANLIRFFLAGCMVGVLAASLLAADDAVPAPDDPKTAGVQREMEAAAERYSHFATDDVISNRPTTRQWPEKFITQQSKLLAELQTWSAQPQSLRAMLDHPDGKVCTLALGALFLREDPHDLSVIAALADDKRPTFKLIHMSMRSVGLGNLADIECPQTVGDVAQAMLNSYLWGQGGKRYSDFAVYWEERKDRRNCASWFLVRLNRATRRTTPLKSEYLPDIERVLSGLEELPLNERAWTQVYLRCRSSAKIETILTDDACIADLNAVGRDEIIRFLERQRVTDDPDLQFDDLEGDNGYVYSHMLHFILRRATQLLGVEDVPFLLRREELERKTPNRVYGVSAYWAVAAAEITGQNDPAEAGKIIDAAVVRFPLSDLLGGRKQAALVGCLWQLRGTAEKQKLVDWFYAAQAVVTEKKRDGSNHGPVNFLISVRKAGRQSTHELMVALVTDPRFEQTDLPAVKEMLDIASEGLTEPIYNWREFYGADRRTPEALIKWREVLTHHYLP